MSRRQDRDGLLDCVVAEHQSSWSSSWLCFRGNCTQTLLNDGACRGIRSKALLRSTAREQWEEPNVFVCMQP